MKSLISFSIVFLFVQIPMTVLAQNEANYNESKVPALILPDPFVSEKGVLIENKEDWEKIRKPEIFNLFESEVYGILP
jgi:hypothetical protein